MREFGLQYEDEKEKHVRFDPDKYKDLRWDEQTKKYIADIFCGTNIAEGVLDEIDELLRPFKLELHVGLNTEDKTINFRIATVSDEDWLNFRK